MTETGRSASLTLRQLLLAALAATLYASCYATIKAGLAYAPPLQFATLRAALGGGTLLVLLAVMGRPLLVPRRLWAATLVLGLFGPLLGFVAMFMSPSHTGVALASVVGNVGPLLIIILAPSVLGEPITGAKLTAVLLGVAGVAAIAWPGEMRVWDSWGLILPILASVSGASEGLVAKRARLGSSVLAVTAWQFVVGAVPLAALSAWLETGQGIVWTTPFALSLGLLAAGTTAAATALWYSVIQEGELSRLSLVLFLVPVMGLALGMLVFGESIGPRQALGVIMVLSGVAVAALTAGGAVPSAEMPRSAAR